MKSPNQTITKPRIHARKRVGEWISLGFIIIVPIIFAAIAFPSKKESMDEAKRDLDAATAVRNRCLAAPPNCTPHEREIADRAWSIAEQRMNGFFGTNRR